MEQFLSLSRNSLHIMEPPGLLPHSQEPAICPYSKPDESSPCHHPISRRSILVLNSHLRLGLPSVSFPLVSPPTPCIYRSSLRATCLAHLIILGFIPRIMLEDESRTSLNKPNEMEIAVCSDKQR